MQGSGDVLLRVALASLMLSESSAIGQVADVDASVGASSNFFGQHCLQPALGAAVNDEAPATRVELQRLNACELDLLPCDAVVDERAVEASKGDALNIAFKICEGCHSC